MGNSSIKAEVRNLDCSIAEGFTEQVTIFRKVVKIWIMGALSGNSHLLSKTLLGTLANPRNHQRE